MGGFGDGEEGRGQLCPHCWLEVDEVGSEVLDVRVALGGFGIVV